MARANRTKGVNRSGLMKRVFFMALFVTATYVVARSSLFEVREIRVDGNTSLSREQIISASGINPGENIFRIDLKAASERVRYIPLIKNVVMSRSLPSSVEVKIEERKAVALMPVDTGFIQIDNEGVYIQKGDIGNNPLPVITGVDFSVPSPGGQIKSEKMDIALMVIKGIPAELTPQLSELNINGDQAVAYTLDGIQCRLGAAGDLKEKGEVLIKVLQGLKEKGKRIEYVDLTYAGSPVVKYIE